MTDHTTDTDARRNRQAIILGIDSPIGLTMIRELARHDVRVIGLARSKAGIGLYSRYLHEGHIRERDEDALIAQLNALASTSGCRWLMTVSENDIQLLHRRQGDLVGITPLIPEKTSFQLVLDKAKINRIADELGIDTPYGWPIDNSQDSANLSPAPHFPLVLKWPDLESVRNELINNNAPLDKYRYVHDPADLQTYLARFDALGVYPLVQSYCPGHGLGQMILMHQGKSVLEFQHRRVREFPPEGGISSVCESSVIDEALMRKSVSLLQTVGWEGPAMVEYRHDPRTGKSCLMEVNGRFWGSLPLANATGAEFVWFTFSIRALGQVPTMPSTRHPQRARFVIPDMQRLYRILFARKRIADPTVKVRPLTELLHFFADYLRLRTRYYVFSFTDPKPFLADLWFILRNRVR